MKNSMKKGLLFISFLLLLVGCKGYKTDKQAEEAYAKTDSTWVADTVYQAGLKYCYGTVWAGDRLLISNYGGEVMDPLNVDKTGYIMQLKDGVLSEYIPAGTLMAPKGMAVLGNYLFVADINCVMVFDMTDLSKAPQVMQLPENNMFVSDLVIQDSLLYVSVRDAGLIYKTEVNEPANVANATMDIFLTTVSGPNGMTAYKDTMYVCSYPQNDSIGKQNAIYMVLNMKDLNPMLYKLESLPGYYCGIQYDPKTRMVYYTDRINGQLRSIDMATGANKLLLPEKILLSPQMLTLQGNKLFVPDVDASRLYVFTIPGK
ncbi:MAG: hypothetical protein RR346_05210 [Bacteroidales bacterium]